jgi:hydrogenase nickel incorporation protein HypA/HybF
MHELAITQSMFELVVAEAQKAGAKKVKKINLVIGEASGFLSNCMQFYFDFMSNGTIAEGATLNFTLVPLKMRCSGCGETFAAEEPEWVCPHCHGTGIEIASGKELFVESIEVD